MEIYKLKHKPTGLYYQPHRHGGSNLSKKGKIYQTKTHGLSSAFKNGDKLFSVYVSSESIVYKQTKDILTYVKARGHYSQMIAKTNVNDWVVEIIKTD